MITRCHLLSLVVTRFICCHSLLFVVIRCHSFSIRCQLLSLVAQLVVTPCTTRYNSLSLVVTQCISRLSFYKRTIIQTKKPAFYLDENLIKETWTISKTCQEILLFNVMRITCFDNMMKLQLKKILHGNH